MSHPSEVLEFKKVPLTIQVKNQLTNSMEHSPSMNLTFPQLVKKFPAYYETQRFITASTTVCHLSYIQPDPLHALISNLLMIHLNIILPSIPRSSKWSLCFRFPHQNPICTFLFSICVASPSISLFSIWSPAYLVSSTGHKAPHSVVFSTPLSPHSSQAKIPSSAPYSQTPSAYVPPSKWDTKFHTHTEQQAKLQFCVSQSVHFLITHHIYRCWNWLPSAHQHSLCIETCCSLCVWLKTMHSKCLLSDHLQCKDYYFTLYHSIKFAKRVNKLYDTTPLHHTVSDYNVASGQWYTQGPPDSYQLISIHSIPYSHSINAPMVACETMGYRTGQKLQIYK